MTCGGLLTALKTFKMNTKTKTDDNDPEDSENVAEGAEPDQLYTFDDIPLYARVYYMGRLGWVIKKGEDIVNTVSDSRHLKIQYKEKHANRKHSHVHEKLVNKFLRKQERLWVDFEHNFETYDN